MGKLVVTKEGGFFFFFCFPWIKAESLRLQIILGFDTTCALGKPAGPRISWRGHNADCQVRISGVSGVSQPRISTSNILSSRNIAIQRQGMGFEFESIYSFACLRLKREKMERRKESRVKIVGGVFQLF